VTLPVFRKLCILKGIFPRDAKIPHTSKKQTYYLAKDIRFLSHEPLITTFRKFALLLFAFVYFHSHRYRSHRMKLSRAIHREEKAAAKSIAEQKPDYNLDHLVRERYPTFVDALRDLDDALSLICAYAHHGQTKNGILYEFILSYPPLKFARAKCERAHGLSASGKPTLSKHGA
jgi:pescadillo protein